MQEEEPREPELVEDGASSLSSRRRAGEATLSPVALTHSRMADRRELADGRLLAVREIRVAVPELLGEIELEPLGKDCASLRSCTIEGEALQHLLGRAQVALAVAASLRLAALERRAAADRDEHVLQQRPPRMVRMDVSGRDCLHAEVLGEVAEKRQAARVPALERALKLDVEPVGAERAGKTHCGIRIEKAETAPRATRKANEPLGRFRNGLERNRGRQRLAIFASHPPRFRVCGREQAAEVGVPTPRLHEQRDVRTAFERHLCSRDRPHAERLRGVRELEGAVDAVVVGEGERPIAELRRARRELLRL